MTKIKLCGLTREEDIEAVNSLQPEYIGLVFAKKSKRYIDPEQAAILKSRLSGNIHTVGVFVNEPVEDVAQLLKSGIIDMAQLHGREDGVYMEKLKALADRPVIKAFRIDWGSRISDIESCPADFVLLDSGAGSGETFEWNLIKTIKRPFFLAGGLDENNVREAIRELHPYAVDVSSGIETNAVKDKEKMAAFVAAVRKETKL